jgi:putative SOS response-associated peptidase YedK
MCGRFTLRGPIDELAGELGIDEVPALEPRYNIAPTQPVATLLTVGSDRRCRMMRWGLVPSWARDESIGHRLINARAESVATKPAFRDAFGQRRCLVVADGFYEWTQPAKGKPKQPWLITRRDGGLFTFAGLWERWAPPGRDPLETCTIITTDANDLVARFHPRMPVILERPARDLWLDESIRQPDRLLALLTVPDADELTATAVSPKVNSPKVDSPECIQPLSDGGQHKLF